MISFKDCITALNRKPEFLGLDYDNLTFITLNCTYSLADGNNRDLQEFIDFQDIFKESDEKPRYCYFGQLCITTDADSLQFFYRSDNFYLRTAVENYLTKDNCLFDFTSILDINKTICWQFSGFRIDRGGPNL